MRPELWPVVGGRHYDRAMTGVPVGWYRRNVVEEWPGRPPCGTHCRPWKDKNFQTLNRSAVFSKNSVSLNLTHDAIIIKSIYFIILKWWLPPPHLFRLLCNCRIQQFQLYRSLFRIRESPGQSKGELHCVIAKITLLPTNRTTYRQGNRNMVLCQRYLWRNNSSAEGTWARGVWRRTGYPVMARHTGIPVLIHKI